jgi:hypothetical protein
MKPKPQIISIIIFFISAIILALGIAQLILYIPPQLEMLRDAELQGATAEQVSDYVWQQFLPQIIAYAISSLGMAATLYASGMIYLKLTNVKIKSSIGMGNQKNPTSRQSSEDDDFFDDFEIVEDDSNQ